MRNENSIWVRVSSSWRSKLVINIGKVDPINAYKFIYCQTNSISRLPKMLYKVNLENLTDGIGINM